MDRTRPFLESIYQIAGTLDLVASESVTRGIIENLRLFGYINEIEYSQMNTILSETLPTVRTDRAETIEMARAPLLVSRGFREPVYPNADDVMAGMDPELPMDDPAQILPREP